MHHWDGYLCKGRLTTQKGGVTANDIHVLPPLQLSPFFQLMLLMSPKETTFIPDLFHIFKVATLTIMPYIATFKYVRGLLTCEESSFFSKRLPKLNWNCLNHKASRNGINIGSIHGIRLHHALHPLSSGSILQIRKLSHHTNTSAKSEDDLFFFR